MCSGVVSMFSRRTRLVTGVRNHFHETAVVEKMDAGTEAAEMMWRLRRW